MSRPDRHSRLLRTALLVLPVAWFAIICALFVFAAPLTEALWILYPVVHWGGAAAGVLMLAWAAWQARRAPWAAGTGALVLAAGLVLFFTAGFQLGRKVLFELRKPRYEALLAEATRTGEVPAGQGHTDEGPPLRFAFYWQRGLMDNWAGVVNDPSGEVLQVNEFRAGAGLSDPRRRDLVSIFGGTLYRCQHVGGDWYICWFT